MTEQGKDSYGVEYKRTSNDFRFRRLEADNCACSICHGIGAKIEFEYITRDYESARRKGKICKSLQAHGHSFWICPKCLDNLNEKKKSIKTSCRWRQDDEHCAIWYTDCENSFWLNPGTPGTNKMKYCPYCGKAIEEIPYR